MYKKSDKRCGGGVQGTAAALTVQGQAEMCGNSCSLLLRLSRFKGCVAISAAAVLIMREQGSWCGGSVHVTAHNCTYYFPFHHYDAIHFLSVCCFIMNFSFYWDLDITRGSLYTLITHPSSFSSHLMPHPEFCIFVFCFFSIKVFILYKCILQLQSVLTFHVISVSQQSS